MTPASFLTAVPVDTVAPPKPVWPGMHPAGGGEGGGGLGGGKGGGGDGGGVGGGLGGADGGMNGHRHLYCTVLPAAPKSCMLGGTQ